MIRPKVCRLAVTVMLVLSTGRENLAQVHRAAFRSDGPDHVGQIFGTEAVCGSKAFKTGLNYGAATFSGYFGRAFGSGHQACAVKANLGGLAAVEVVNSRNVTAN